MTKLRAWPLWAQPLRVLVLLLSIEAFAAVCSVMAFAHESWATSDLLRFGLLITLSVVYAEVSRQVEIRRSFLSAGAPASVNMTSVWVLAAALTLPAGLTAITAVAVWGHMWARSWRHVPGAKAYATAFNFAVAVVCGLAVVSTVRVVLGGSLASTASSTTLLSAVAVGSAILVYRLVNLTSVTAVISLGLGRFAWRALASSAVENAVEFATLGLGAVAAVAMVQAPWSVVMTLPAVFLLQHHALLKQLVHAATVDAKTELLNASAWRQVAERELARAERTGADAAVLLIDMDHFKQINDTHGHLAGDAALKAVGEALADELRAYDAVGRFGGEEFVALLPTLDAPAGLAVAERVRRRIEATPVPVGGGVTVTFTASVGVASSRSQGSSLDDLLGAADRALYAAKAAGRNTVRAAKHSALRVA